MVALRHATPSNCDLWLCSGCAAQMSWLEINRDIGHWTVRMACPLCRGDIEFPIVARSAKSLLWRLIEAQTDQLHRLDLVRHIVSADPLEFTISEEDWDEGRSAAEADGLQVGN